MAHRTSVNGFERRVLISMAGGCADLMGQCLRFGQRCNTNKSAIAIRDRLDVGPAFMPPQDLDLRTQQKLAIPRAIRFAQQIHYSATDLSVFVQAGKFGIRGQSGMGHLVNILSRASSNARVPCPTPPLARAGAATGCQPYMSKCA